MVALERAPAGNDQAVVGNSDGTAQAEPTPRATHRPPTETAPAATAMHAPLAIANGRFMVALQRAPTGNDQAVVDNSDGKAQAEPTPRATHRLPAGAAPAATAMPALIAIANGCSTVALQRAPAGNDQAVVDNSDGKAQAEPTPRAKHRLPVGAAPAATAMHAPLAIANGCSVVALQRAPAERARVVYRTGRDAAPAWSRQGTGRGGATHAALLRLVSATSASSTSTPAASR